MDRVARLAGHKATNGLVTRTVREAALWVLGAIALIMLLALLTYDPRDPGFSHTGDGGLAGLRRRRASCRHRWSSSAVHPVRRR